MKKLARYINRYWWVIIAGIILTKVSVEKMYGQRGGFYIGGEWLLIPFIIMVTAAVPQMIREFFDLYREEDEDAGKVMGDH